MSLMLEFQTPQNPEARSAGIGTNRCFPMVAQPTGATDCSGGMTAAPIGKTTGAARPTSSSGQSAPTRFRDPLIASPTLRNYQ